MSPWKDSAHLKLSGITASFLRLLAVGWLGSSVALAQPAPATWSGTLRDAAGNGLPGAEVELRLVPSGEKRSALTDSAGRFSFSGLAPGCYAVSVKWRGEKARRSKALLVGVGERLEASLQIASGGADLILHRAAAESAEASGRERLSSQEVSSLPLNKRDFSQLLLLAAGTMTDTNGAANFTQQFAVNGQRGTTTVFAMDGIDITDPELGGATFSNFNVDAIQEIQSSSGVMPPEIGHGAAGFTDIVTRSGTDGVHGSVFSFVRNAAFDARNFFDRRSLVSPGRIPPFVRNEFGFTNGGPLVLPGLYDGRKRTYYFGQYQGFRQVLGTTQILAVPTADERQGEDTTAFPGDTLRAPVNPEVAPVLARYPLPNDLQGPYGPRTYATSSKVSTTTDQFSIRIDHRLSERAQLFARFNLDQVNGPLTNPDQTALDPSFAIRFYDHQRNFGLTYTRTVSPRLVSESSLGIIRTTPFFPTINHTDPALKFADGLYESFDGPGGTVTGAIGNLLQARQNFTSARGAHTFKFGGEARFNRDTTIFGIAPNGEYTFGGGTAYAPARIPSDSGQHDIQAGDPLPDALTGLLTGTPYSYDLSVAGPNFPSGDHIGETALRRDAYNFYYQDTWRASPRFTLTYGVRYEIETPIAEANHLLSTPVFLGPNGEPAPTWAPGTTEKFIFYPRPSYPTDWRGWGPRLSAEWRAADHTVVRAGGAITTILTNLFQDDWLTAGIPMVFTPYLTASPGAPVPFQYAVRHFDLPPVYTPAGQLVFASGNSKSVPANTEIDLLRFEQDLAALTPGNQIHPLTVIGMSKDFRNGYIESYTAGIEQSIGEVTLSASYVGTAGVKLPGPYVPNGFGGADPGFAPYGRFDAAGNFLGGYGPEYLMTNVSHSTYHALQAGVQKTSSRAGLGFQANYTFSKSLDDTSSVLGGFFGSSGTVLQTFPQDPRNPGKDKGPSTFDIAHVFTLSLIQALPMDRLHFLQPLGRKVTSGWQLLNITTLMTGSPFSVISGIEQTGLGAGGADRPDQVGRPDLSTSRTAREDYFGRGADNASFFSIPIDVAGGTGPNQGRLGTLGRDTFRGPGYHNLDVALIKDTAFGRRGNTEAAVVQFRAEFFNVFNLVNFGLPSNILLGSGFGIINRTAGTSRQIQLSLKLIY